MPDQHIARASFAWKDLSERNVQTLLEFATTTAVHPTAEDVVRWTNNYLRTIFAVPVPAPTDVIDPFAIIEDALYALWHAERTNLMLTTPPKTRQDVAESLRFAATQAYATFGDVLLAKNGGKVR